MSNTMNILIILLCFTTILLCCYAIYTRADIVADYNQRWLDYVNYNCICFKGSPQNLTQDYLWVVNNDS